MTYAARELRRDGTASERLLWQALRGRRYRGLKFRRQQPLRSRFIADFYCAELKVVIEIDGASHDGREVMDAERQEALEAEGIRVLRIRVEEIGDDVVSVLDRVFNRHLTLPSPASRRGF